MNQFSTIYSQFLKHLPRAQFQTCVKKYDGDYRVRTFTCWSQMATMMFAQVTGKVSLRDLETAWQRRANHYYHCGLVKVAHSTLADANQNRDWRIYQEVFTQVLLRCRDVAPKHKFRFKNKLESFDGSTVKLCLETFPWAKFRRRKGAIKLHTRLDHRGYLPSFVHITPAKTHEIKVARTLEIEADSILVFDRGVVDYEWFYRIEQSEAFFVTRAKKNLSYEVVPKPKRKLRPLSQRAQKKGVLKDEVIRIVGTNAEKLPMELRLVTYCDPETGIVYKYLTNLFHLSALTIAEIYRERWQIELFFKWIKQHLKIKTFLGTTENAVMTQIWIAMITYLIMAYIKYQSKYQGSLLTLQRLLQNNIFERVALHVLLFPERRCDNTTATATAANPKQLVLAI